jgi:hypothetical protein
MTTADFAVQYGDMSDFELTQLASEGGLRPEAEVALKAELRKRSIGSKEVRVLRVEQKRTKLQTAANNPYFARGSGLQLRGNKFLTESDRNRGITVATRWIVFACLPLIPIGSYRIKRHDNYSKPEIVSKVSLQWDQVWRGWGVAAMIVLAVIAALAAMIAWSELHR